MRRPVIGENQAIPLLKSHIRTKRDRVGSLERQRQTYMQGKVKNRKESERDRDRETEIDRSREIRRSAEGSSKY